LGIVDDHYIDHRLSTQDEALSGKLAPREKRDMQRNALGIAVFTIVAGVAVIANAQVVKQEVPGIRNLAKVESTVACAGAITPGAVSEIKAMGYGAIINLRLATEEGADIEAHSAAAKAAGIPYYHIPFSSAAPDPAAVDTFLKTITTPGVEPAFIHCAGAGRAAGMWLMKRTIGDGWSTDKALEEATALGLRNETLKQFFVTQIEQRKR
jgi:uncharacterized protein (TIGR01244 family)